MGSSGVTLAAVSGGCTTLTLLFSLSSFFRLSSSRSRRVSRSSNCIKVAIHNSMKCTKMNSHQIILYLFKVIPQIINWSVFQTIYYTYSCLFFTISYYNYMTHRCKSCFIGLVKRRVEVWGQFQKWHDTGARPQRHQVAGIVNCDALNTRVKYLPMQREFIARTSILQWMRSGYKK